MSAFEPLRIIELIVSEVGIPRNDGSRGSALYEVPFRLSKTPPHDWGQFFVHYWNRPPQWTSMHRPGIASVVGDRVILDKTSIEEVEKYHKATLLLAVEEANKKYAEYLDARERAANREQERIRQHQEDVEKRARGIQFD